MGLLEECIWETCRIQRLLKGFSHFSPNSTGLNISYHEMASVHSILQVRLTPRYMSTVNKTAVQEAPDRPVDTQFCLHKSKIWVLACCRSYFLNLIRVIPVVPHEAVPEVSKGKVNINQKKMCL